LNNKELLFITLRHLCNYYINVYI